MFTQHKRVCLLLGELTVLLGLSIDTCLFLERVNLISL